MNTEKIMKKRNFIPSFAAISTLLVLLFPLVSYADFPPNLTSFVCLILSSIKILVPIMDGIAILLFFWGVARFILAAGNEKELAAGRQFMIWGVIAIFVLVSFWGILQFMADQFGFGNATWHFLPTGNTSTGSCG